MSRAGENLTENSVCGAAEVDEPARVVRDSDGDVRGVTLVLSADDLRSLGLINEEAVNARVFNGALLVEATSL